jgi:hypothetical protein
MNAPVGVSSEEASDADNFPAPHIKQSIATGIVPGKQVPLDGKMGSG